MRCPRCHRTHKSRPVTQKKVRVCRHKGEWRWRLVSRGVVVDDWFKMIDVREYHCISCGLVATEVQR